MKKTILPILVLIFLCTNIFSQDTINEIKNIPKFGGLIKTKIENDLENNLYRFEVRNARFSLTDNINDLFGYRMQIDLSNEGKIVMLDAYVKFTPFKNFELSLGQRKIPFGTDYQRNPAENFFANRSFVSKYVNNGLRDIGVVAKYKFNMLIPLEINLAAMNGTGNNNPQWVKYPDWAGRFIFGSEEGFRFVANTFSGEHIDESDLMMYGIELRYKNEKFLIESEILNRDWTDSLKVRNHSNGFYIHSYYKFLLQNENLKVIYPTLRWDMMGENVLKFNNQAERFTIGLNLGFEKKMFYSEIRINYEKYFKALLPIHTNKFTLEVIARF